MTKSIPALVEPTLLRWARETIDLTEVAASRKLGLPDDRVAAWEAGEVQPTIAQLRRAAALYKRSLAVFFLAEPPEGFDTLRDFRRHDGADSGAWTPALHADYRRALIQRGYMLELDELEEIDTPTGWGVDRHARDDEQLAALARERVLSSSPLRLPAGQSPSVYDHLNAWTAGLEALGILVLATTRGNVDTAEMRGFSLYFDKVPVIMVNGADAPRGRLFTLLHEYAHLLLHTGGLCDLITDARAVAPNRQLEARCNAIAASILMPRKAVLARPQVREREHERSGWDYDSLAAAAAPFGVSAEAFLRRLLTLDRVDRDYYQARRDEFAAVYEAESQDRQKGGSWYRNTVRDLGKGYVRLIADAHRRRVIDSYTAATYLNVKVSQIPRLAETAALREAV